MRTIPPHCAAGDFVQNSRRFVLPESSKGGVDDWMDLAHSELSGELAIPSIVPCCLHHVRSNDNFSVMAMRVRACQCTSGGAYKKGPPSKRHESTFASKERKYCNSF